MEIKAIAHMESELKTKFGIPRQPGLAEELRSRIVFENEYKNPDALRGLDGFSHIWLIWGFSLNETRENGWDATVRPPRLGGNTRVGVFASRSPNRPNPIGLSCVRIAGIDIDECAITVLGADLADGTPIYDIKPYVPYTDCRPDAKSGFAVGPGDALKVEFDSAELKERAEKLFDKDALSALIRILSLDPRPSYQDDPDRIYGTLYGKYDVRFRVRDNTLYIKEIAAV